MYFRKPPPAQILPLEEAGSRWGGGGRLNQSVGAAGLCWSLLDPQVSSLLPLWGWGVGGGGGDQMVTLVKDEPSELVVRTSLRKCRLLISFVPD